MKPVNVDLLLKTAEQYELEVNKVEKGDGGFFYIDENGKKVKVSLTDECSMYAIGDIVLVFGKYLGKIEEINSSTIEVAVLGKGKILCTIDQLQRIDLQLLNTD